jgi:hypothetical protein
MAEAVQELTANINTIRSELAKWGTPDTPIYVGEIGGAYGNPGKHEVVDCSGFVCRPSARFPRVQWSVSP